MDNKEKSPEKELIESIGLMIEKGMESNTNIYTGVVKSVDGKRAVVTVNGQNQNVSIATADVSSGNVVRVFVPEGNMSAAFIIKAEASGGGGGTTTTAYGDLTGKPQINGVTLVDNKTSKELNLYGTGNAPPYPVTSVNGQTGDITIATGGNVDSVNGKTGVVVLSAADVGALPNTTVIPDKTSQLTNDSGFITNSALTDYAKKTEIPTKTSELTNDSGYLTSVPVTSVNSKTGAVVLTANDVGALPADTVIPTVNNATLTIRRNSVDIGSFTANSANDVNIDINVPTDKSDIGLGNVDNVKQYSATNPPPYPVTSVNGAIGEVKSTFYVTVTQGDNNTATADKTAEEVYAAYAAGYAVYAIVNLKPDIGYPIVVPMVVGVKQSNQVALIFITLTGFHFMQVQYIMSAWSVKRAMLASIDDIPTVPEYLPNPNALNIKIGDTTTSYDGSAAKTVEIPEGVPSVTTADNGKFLRVVNGAWAAVEIANANGGSF